MRRNFSLLVFFVVLCVAAAGWAGPSALAQSGPTKSAQQPAGNGSEIQKRIAEIAEARRELAGAAGNPECVWLGRRVIALLWRDDMDTALRHLEVYDRFKCPSAHLQAAFRCLVRQGPFDPKAAATLNSRLFACWIDPTMKPQPVVGLPARAPAATPAPRSGRSGGTTPR